MITILILVSLLGLYIFVTKKLLPKKDDSGDIWAHTIIRNKINAYWGKDVCVDSFIMPLGAFSEEPYSLEWPLDRLLIVSVLVVFNGHVSEHSVLVEEITEKTITEAAGSLILKIDAYLERLTISGC